MVEEAQASPDMGRNADTGTKTITLPAAAPEIGFSQPVMIAFGVGVMLMLLTGLFRAIVITSDSPSEGLADTSVWFGWLGTSILSLTLIGAGFAARTATIGARVALVLVGTYVFIQATDAYAGVRSAFSQFF